MGVSQLILFEKYGLENDHEMLFLVSPPHQLALILALLSVYVLALFTPRKFGFLQVIVFSWYWAEREET